MSNKLLLLLILGVVFFPLVAMMTKIRIMMGHIKIRDWSCQGTGWY